MSVESMAAALRIPGLKPSAKLVLVGIANHDGDGGAWPSKATLAMYAGVSTRQVQKLIGELVDARLVSVDTNAGGTSSTRPDRRPNLYRLHLDGVSPGSPRGSNGESPGAVRGVPQRANGESCGSPEPSSEPSSTVQELPLASQTADQVARDVVDKYWDWVKARQDDRPPAGGTGAYLRLVNTVRPLIEAGWPVPAIKNALVALFTAGRNLSISSVESQLRGSGVRPVRSAGVDVDRGAGSGVVAV